MYNEINGTSFCTARHRNSVGRRKVIFIFHHEAKEFALYYDVLCPTLINALREEAFPNFHNPYTRPHIYPHSRRDSARFYSCIDEKIRLAVRGDVLPLEGE